MFSKLKENMEKQLTTEEKLKLLQQAKCNFPDCNRQSIMHVSVPMASITESGKLIYPQETKDTSIGIGVALCGYHLYFSFMGLIASTENQVIAPNVKEWVWKNDKTGEKGTIEDLSDKELKETIKKLKKLKSKESEFWSKVGEAILEGRKFLNKEIKSLN